MADKTMAPQGHFPDGTSAPNPLEAEENVPLPAKPWPVVGMGVLRALGVASVGYQTEVPGRTTCLSSLRI